MFSDSSHSPGSGPRAGQRPFDAALVELPTESIIWSAIWGGILQAQLTNPSLMFRREISHPAQVTDLWANFLKNVKPLFVGGLLQNNKSPEHYLKITKVLLFACPEVK